MSATAACLSCPVCKHSGAFESVQFLRDRLIYVSTNKILCPVCQEEVSGLDKLTIHLFSHVKILNTKNCVETMDPLNIKSDTKLENQGSNATQQKKPRPTSKNKTPFTAAAAPVKYVKIFPKLPVVSVNPVPVIDVSRRPGEEQMRSVSPTHALKTEVSLAQSNTTCNVCGLQFVDADILRMHRCLIHNIDDNSNHNVTRYQCHLCPKNFKMRGSLMVHLRVAHYGFLSGNCNSDTKTVIEGKEGRPIEKTSDDKLLLLERNDNKQWQCDVCRKCFTTKYFLKKHKRLHTGETPYSCTQCNKTFTFQQSYHKHLLYHNDEKPHTCSFCGRAFKELSTLHNHQRIHTGEKPFSCESCGKCFRQRVSYLVHRRIHTGVMPYKCTACEKSFRYKVSQRTHKCPSKPPGTVIRQPGDLVEKLKKKHAVTGKSSEQNVDLPVIKTNYLEVSEANAELVRSGAKLSLEDMESENFSLIADTFDSNSNIKNQDQACCSKNLENGYDDKVKNVEAIDPNLDALIDVIPVLDKNIPSPSEILKNLCLSKEDEYISILETTDDKNYDLYKDFEVFM